MVSATERPPAQPFRQPSVPPEAEQEMLGRGSGAKPRGWRRGKGRCVRGNARWGRGGKGGPKGAAGCPRPGGEHPPPPTYVEGRSPPSKRAREASGGDEPPRRRRRYEGGRRSAGTTATKRGVSSERNPGPEPTPTDRGLAMLLPRHFTREAQQRGHSQSHTPPPKAGGGGSMGGGKEGAGYGPRVGSRGGGGAGPLREVNMADERGGEAQNLPVQGRGPQGGAARHGALFGSWSGICGARKPTISLSMQFYTPAACCCIGLFPLPLYVAIEARWKFGSSQL